MGILSESILKEQSLGYLCTGDRALDDALASAHQSSDTAADEGASGHLLNRGIPSRALTELSGPPGSGKTSLWLSLVKEALKRGLSVLYISCDYDVFPFARAEHLEGWRPERFNKRIDQCYIDSLERFLTLELAWSRYAIVVVDHYEKLTQLSKDRESQSRAADACIAKLNSMAETSCVVATSGCIKYRNEEDCSLLAPATISAAQRLALKVRLMCYKDVSGCCVLSTGTRFKNHVRLPEESPVKRLKSSFGEEHFTLAAARSNFDSVYLDQRAPNASIPNSSSINSADQPSPMEPDNASHPRATDPRVTVTPTPTDNLNHGDATNALQH